MEYQTNPFDSVKIASPCSADWEDMFGDNRTRFCGQCELNVYNLSDMTKREAEALISQSVGRLCVRYFKRNDGTILTSDCPVGLRALKRNFTRLRVAVVSFVLSFFAGLGVYSAASQNTAEFEPVRGVVMGAIEAPERPVESVSELPVVQGQIAVHGSVVPNIRVSEQKGTKPLRSAHAR